MTSAKDDLEVQKLAQEVETGWRDARRPWLLQMVLPALISSIATGMGGYLFGESAAEKNRAEIRKGVLAQYFAVDNEIAGKRKQILGFIQATLAKDDPDLAKWASGETQVVDARLRDIELERSRVKSEIAELESEKPPEPQAVAAPTPHRRRTAKAKKLEIDLNELTRQGASSSSE